jgi:methyltransferase (TIGR00027 family)
MKPGNSSQTAEYMAFFRGLESARERNQRLFVDPFAVAFLRSGLRKAVGVSHYSWLRRGIESYVDWRLPGARTSGVARTRLIDDTLGRLVRGGIAQLVILGAGFDCRALRLECLREAVVFEVDHPATLARKLAVLQEQAKALPAKVRYVQMEFTRQQLAPTLDGAGFRFSLPTIFLWEGVTNYLTKAAVEAVLQCVAKSAAGTRLIFTYIDAGLLNGSTEFEGGKRLMRDVQTLNEPWTFGVAPDELGSFLKKNGLILDHDLSAKEYRRLYYGEAAEKLKGYEFYHVACACVPNRAHDSEKGHELQREGESCRK